MLARIKSLVTNDEGLEMVEYALIIAVVALLALVGYTTLGASVNKEATNVALKLDASH